MPQIVTIWRMQYRETDGDEVIKRTLVIPGTKIDIPMDKVNKWLPKDTAINDLTVYFVSCGWYVVNDE